MITFFGLKCSIVFLNAGSHIKPVLEGTVKADTLIVDRIPNLFEVLIWFHYVNTVTNYISDRKLYVKLNYRSGIIVTMVVQSVCLAWTQLIRRTGKE